MKRFCALILVLFVMLGITAAQPTRVGTFDRTAIVVAFYRSPLWVETLKAKQAELEAAKRANDQAKVQELNAWGGQAQELAHQQLAGTAPITNILQALQPAFLELEQTLNLASVVPASELPEKAQAVDVTDKLLDWLRADENTRRIIQGLPHN